MVLFTLSFLSGCSVTPQRVDPYTGLLPTGASIQNAPERLLRTSVLKKEKVYVVTGANFEAYAQTWEKVDKQVKGGSIALLVNSQAELNRMQEAWSPAFATNKLVLMLKKYFGEVVIASDLADARSKNASWVVLFDHAFEQPTTATATWTNTTVVDLLDDKLHRLVHGEYSAKKDYGMAWGNSDVMRFSVNRGKDIQESADKGVANFEEKLKVILR